VFHGNYYSNSGPVANIIYIISKMVAGRHLGFLKIDAISPWIEITTWNLLHIYFGAPRGGSRDQNRLPVKIKDGGRLLFTNRKWANASENRREENSHAPPKRVNLPCTYVSSCTPHRLKIPTSDSLPCLLQEPSTKLWPLSNLLHE